jgi:hypothetical protein
VTVEKACTVFLTQTNRAARVRAYATSAYRSVDATRALNVDPIGDHGCLLEVITIPGALTAASVPAAVLFNLDAVPSATIYFRVTNLDSVTGAVTTTLTVHREE